MLFQLNGSCDTQTGSQEANYDCPRNTLAGLHDPFQDLAHKWQIGDRAVIAEVIRV